MGRALSATPDQIRTDFESTFYLLVNYKENKTVTLLNK